MTVTLSTEELNPPPANLEQPTDEPPTAAESIARRREEQARVRERVSAGGDADSAAADIMSLSSVVGLGPDGPGFGKIGPSKFQVGPYTMARQPLAVLCFEAMGVNTLTAILAWSTRNGEGELTSEDAAAVYAKLVSEEQRKEVTPDSLMATLSGGLMSITEDELDCIADAIALSANRYDESVTGEFVKENLDYAQAIKLLGKILAMNTGLKHRFFSPLSAQD